MKMLTKETGESVKTKTQKLTRHALVPIVLVQMCFLLPYGYTLGTFNAAAQPLRRFYNESYMVRYGSPITDSTLDLIWSISVSAFPLGGALGCLVINLIVSNFGQRKTMIMNHMFCVLGALLLSLSVLMHSFEAIIFGEILIGICCSAGFAVGASYSNDLSAQNMRGPLGCLLAVATGIGLIAGNALSLEQILGTDAGWPYLFAVTGIPSVVFLLCTPLIPENPRTLYVILNQKDRAKSILTKLRGTDDLDEVLNDYKTDAKFQSNFISVWEALTNSSHRWQLISAIVTITSLQLSGINGITYNMNTIFITAGINPSDVTYVSIGVSASQLIASIAATFLSQRFGRKSFFNYGNAVMVFSILLYTLSLAFLSDASWLSYVAVVSTFAYIVGFNAGPAAVAFIIAPEILSLRQRPAVMSVAVFLMWISFIGVSFATPYMFTSMGFAVLLPYMVLDIVAISYVYFFIPETKDKSSYEIMEYFARKKTTLHSAIKLSKTSFSSEDMKGFMVTKI